MSDYASMKVPELKKLLAEKKLAQTGNKADLIARLQEEDNKAAGAAPEAKPAVAKEDEITYSDDEAAKPTASEPAPAAASTTVAPAEPAQDAAAPAAAADAAPAAPAPSFAMGLGSSAVDEETRKRAERAKRFGIEEDDDAKKRADRAERFGIDEKDLAKGLDSALPSRPLKRGRGHQDGNRPGKRHNNDRRDRRNGRQERDGGSQPQKSAGIMQDPVEKAKAEKRAARFAAA